MWHLQAENWADHSWRADWDVIKLFKFCDSKKQMFMTKIMLHLSSYLPDLRKFPATCKKKTTVARYVSLNVLIWKLPACCYCLSPTHLFVLWDDDNYSTAQSVIVNIGFDWALLHTFESCYALYLSLLWMICSMMFFTRCISPRYWGHSGISPGLLTWSRLDVFFVMPGTFPAESGCPGGELDRCSYPLPWNYITGRTWN